MKKLFFILMLVLTCFRFSYVYVVSQDNKYEPLVLRFIKGGLKKGDRKLFQDTCKNDLSGVQIVAKTHKYSVNKQKYGFQLVKDKE